MILIINKHPLVLPTRILNKIICLFFSALSFRNNLSRLVSLNELRVDLFFST